MLPSAEPELMWEESLRLILLLQTRSWHVLLVLDLLWQDSSWPRESW